MSHAPVRLCAGLMSGTSVDAVDGVLAAFPMSCPTAPAGLAGTESLAPRSAISATPARAAALRLPETLTFRSREIPSGLREALQSLQRTGDDELARAALAANQLAELYAEVVSDLLEAAGRSAGEVAAIGAHGQTVRHRPDLGYTLQLLNPARLAERTGITVVADLRSADVAAGGQGAPLAPGFHAEVFADRLKRRAVVNLGGIANVSLIAPLCARASSGPGCDAGPADTPSVPGCDTGPADNASALGCNTGPAGTASVLGWDTGPANTLLDLWCRRHTGAPFDADGAWAAGGRVLEPLLKCLLEEPYFRLPAPKSTGRDRFEAGWLEAMLQRAACVSADPRDVQATLAELTAVTVAQPCRSFGAEEVWICGGGARNADLVQRLARALAPVPVADTGALGVDPQAVEATAFAWLAHRRLSNLPGNLAAVTGAAGPRVLGAVWPAGRTNAGAAGPPAGRP